MDNRNLANQELENAFGGSITAMTRSAPSNFVELPNPEEELNGSGSVVNNYNVNVNVSGRGGSTSNPAVQSAAARQIVNNILTDSPLMSPNEVKKNSTMDSSPGGDSNVVFLENGSNKIELIERAINTGPSQPILDIRDVDYFSPEKPSDYSYSQSPAKSKNTNMKISYDILHYLTKAGISDHSEMSSVPKTVLNTEFSANLKETTFNYFENQNIKTEETNNSIHQRTSKASEENQRMLHTREKERDEALVEMSRGQASRKPDSQMEFSEIRDGQVIAGNNLPPVTTLNTSGVRDFTNITSKSTTIDMFIDKMNSPPNWRTVLG